MRKQYSKKEIKQFIDTHPLASRFLDKKSQVIEDEGKIYHDGKVLFCKYNEEWIPSLELLREHKILPAVVVDKGTPPFLAKGADLMRPGVVRCEDFDEGALVVVVDEVHGYPVATGKALFSSEELLSQEGGKVVKVLFNLKS